MKKILKFLAEVFIAVVVCVFLLLAIIRLLFPYYIDRHHSQLTALISQSLAHPVTIEKIQADWDGLYPIFNFDHIVVLDNNSTKLPLLTIKHLRIGINVLVSLISRNLTPTQLDLMGTSLQVQQLADNHFNINGIDLRFAAQSKPNSLQSMLNKVLDFGWINLADVNVDWHGKEGLILPTVQLKLQSSGGLFWHKVVGIATIKQTNSPGHLRFVVKLHRTIPDLYQIDAKAYVEIRNLALGGLKLPTWQGFAISNGQIPDLQLWASLHEREIKTVQTVFKLNQVAVTLPKSQSNVLVNTLSGNVAWVHNDNGWDLAADHLHLQVDNQSWPLTMLSIQNRLPHHHQPGVQFYRVNAVELASLGHILLQSSLLTDSVKEALTAMQPTGNAQNIMIRREYGVDQAAGISVAAEVKQLSTQAWNKIPGIENLNGRVLFTPLQGELQLAGNGLTVNAPHVFKQPVPLSAYQGQVLWLRTDNGLALQANNIAFNNEAISFRGTMNLLLPQSGSPYLHVLAGFSVDQIAQLQQYVPAGILSTKLTAWLDSAFVGGHKITGALLLQGPLSHFPFTDHTGRFELTAHADNVDFRFHPDWPVLTNVNADVLLNSKRLDINVINAKILGAPVTGIRGTIADLTTAILTIQSKIKADASDALHLIAESPLKKPLSGLQQIAMQGPIQLDLALAIPLHDIVHPHPIPKVDGNIIFEPTVSAQVPGDIRLTQLQGSIHFTENQVQSQGLQAQWLGQPVTISLASVENPEASTSSTSIQFNGNTAIDSLIKAYQLAALRNIIKGAINYTALLQIKHNKDQIQTKLVINSDLKGVAVDLPAPVGKNATSQAPLQVQVNFAPDQFKLFANLAKKLSVAAGIGIDKAGKHFLQSANVRFGAKPATIPTTKGITIDGALAQLDWSDISDLLAPYMTGNKNSRAANPLAVNSINLLINQLDAVGISVQNAKVQAYPDDTAWHLQINSPTVVGNMTLAKNLASQGVQANFQRFAFVPSTKPSSHSTEPDKVPPLNIVLNNFSYEQRQLGQVNLVTSPQEDALVIKKLTVKNPSIQLTAQGFWQQQGSHQQTMLKGNLQSSNLGAGLKTWDVTHGLESGQGKASFVLSWPAAAYKYDAALLNGNFSFEFHKGRVMNISQGSEAEMGIGRILNLLSLQSLPRRLSLDFSDLFSKGFTFDTMKGDLKIANGNATTNNIYVNGPIAKVTAAGRIGLGAKDYNLQMTITPYVTASIPVVATIAGGPIAGAVAWVASKVFGGVVNQITSHTYHVTGPWDNPVIEKISTLNRKNQSPPNNRNLNESSN